MLATESIASSLQTAHGFAGALFRDMRGSPLARTAPGGKHAYWLLGHLVVSHGAVLDGYLLGRPNRYQQWVSLFGIGTHPGEMDGNGPGFDELLTNFDAIHAATLELVSGLSAEDLDTPCHASDWPGPKFDSMGECLIALAQHASIHAGQLTCARHADGRAPLFPFSP